MATVKMVGRKVTLNIPSGQTATDVVDLGAGPAAALAGQQSGSYRRWDLQIIALSGAHTGTVNVQVSDTETVAGNFRVLQSGGADIVVAANKATPIIPIIGRYIRLVSGSAEGAQRDFVLLFSSITNDR